MLQCVQAFVKALIQQVAELIASWLNLQPKEVDESDAPALYFVGSFVLVLELFFLVTVISFLRQADLKVHRWVKVFFQ